MNEMSHLDPQSTWTPDDTLEYLSANPLPKNFVWKHKHAGLVPVQPTYAVADYGKWLRETPNFQGLFELIHAQIMSAGAKLPDIQTITAQLDEIRSARERQAKLL